MKDKAYGTLSCIFALAVIATLLLLMLASKTMGFRVTALETQIAEKIRPVIHIERASVYNMDGELVVDTEGGG